jgi:hypothetical protein
MSGHDGSLRESWWAVIETLISVSEHDECLRLDEDLLARVAGSGFDPSEAASRWMADVLSGS